MSLLSCDVEQVSRKGGGRQWPLGAHWALKQIRGILSGLTASGATGTVEGNPGRVLAGQARREISQSTNVFRPGLGSSGMSLPSAGKQRNPCPTIRQAAFLAQCGVGVWSRRAEFNASSRAAVASSKLVDGSNRRLRLIGMRVRNMEDNNTWAGKRSEMRAPHQPLPSLP